MEEKSVNITIALRRGDEVVCRRCKKGYYIPYPIKTPPQKATCFKCAVCESTINMDPQIDIE